MIKTIKKIKIDSTYGKKKHFNAADRNEGYHFKIGISLTIINLIMSTVLFYVLTDSATSWAKYIPIALTSLALLLSGIQTYLNFNKKAEGHRMIGNQYLVLMKKCDRLEAYMNDKIIENKDIIQKIEELASRIDSINSDAGAYPTSKNDYEKARTGIESGEEFYAKKELKI